jgi:hypothetical protein
MLSWIIQITIISTVLIFLVHYLINFFKSTLTVPKIKDLVNTPTQKYESMYNIINNRPEPSPPSSSDNYTLIDLLPIKEAPTMKNELKDFLKKQLHTPSSRGPEVLALEPSIGSTNSFSTY